MRKAGALTLLIAAIVIPASVGWGQSQFTVTITSGPAGTTSSTTASFQWTATESANFSCRLDGAPPESCGGGTSGSKAYANLAPGQHTFTVNAFVPRAGRNDSDQRTWTVTTTPTPTPDATPSATATTPPDPTPTPRPIQGTISTAASREPVIRGFDASARELFKSKLPRLETLAPKVVTQGENADAKFERTLKFIPCALPAACDEGRGDRSPRPTAPVRTIEGATIDPQIAASASHVVVTNYNSLRILGKDGKVLTKAVTGETLPDVYDLRAIFYDLFEPGPNSVNRGLNLPAGLNCDTSVNALTLPAGSPGVKDCLLDIYDARVVFDSYRKRFVLTALIRNGGSGPSYMVPALYPDPAQRVGRRTRVLIAYSKSQDPRDGWNLSWINGEWGLGECNDIGSEPVDVIPRCPQGHLRPGDAIDYPHLGVSPKGIQLVLNVVHRNPYNVNADNEIKPSGAQSYQRLISIPAASIINGTGKKANGGFSWNDFSLPLHDGPQKMEVYLGTGAVRQHAPSNFGSAYWLTPFPARNMVVLLEQREGKPYEALDFTALPVSQFATPSGGSDLSGWSVVLHNVVQRTGEIVAALGTCRAWEGGPSGECTAAIRVVRFPLSAAEDGVVIWDRTFGRRNDLDDPPVGRDYVPYGYPAVDTTPLDDAVISFNRSDDDLPMEARYSVWFNFEEDLRPSRLFKAGTGACSDVGLHYATSAAEPAPSFARGDEAGVWLYNYFAKDVFNDEGDLRCGTTYAVTKVLGKKTPDIGYRGVRPGGPSSILAFFENNGDKASAATTAQWVISGRGPDVKGTFRVPAIRSGAVREVRFDPGDRLRPGRYEITIKTKARGREYSLANNVVTDVLRIRG